MSAAESGLSEIAAIRRLGWSRNDLWMAFLAIGGNGTASDLDQHLRTGNHLVDAQRDCLAAALNDGLIDAGDLRRVAYVDEIRVLP